MSYQVDYKFNPNKQQAMGFNTPQPVASETLKQNINTNPVVKSAKEENPIFLIGMMLPLWLALSKGMDKFNKACKGSLNEGSNLINKVSNVGDKIGSVFGKTSNGKLRSDSFFEFVGQKLKLINDKFIKKFTILDCLVNHPTKPESNMVRMVASGTLGELVQDAPTMFTKYASLGDGKYDIKKLNSLGFHSAADFEDWKKKDLLKEVDDVISRCRGQKSVNGAKIENDLVEFAVSKDKSWMKKKMLRLGMSEETYNKSLGRIGKFLSRNIYFTEMANKLEALKGVNGNAAKTATGKIFTKSFLRFAEGMTNATAGGKLAIAMQAFCFAQSIGQTIDAPKGEKIKTLMESLVYNLSFYLLMPLGIGLMHHATGLKYLGMTGEQIDKYRKEVKALNKAVDDGLITKAQHAERLKALKILGKGDTKLNGKDSFGKNVIRSIKNIIYKPLRFLARNTLGIGLEAIKPFTETSPKTVLGKVGKFMKKLPYRLKFGAGYPVRFLGYMMLFAPPLAAAVVKMGPHAIFGRPTKSVLDDDKAEEKPLPPLVYPPQETAASAIATAAPSADAIMQSVKTDNVNNYNTQNMVNPNQQNQRTFITTQAKNEQAQRRYIPSSDGVKVTMVDPKEAKAKQILLESVKSEKIANKYLN